ncbi:MAG: hypothetical protein P1P84_01245 [Deferrisomatales bacterium]|nr:hypothetical protein [Deferrisomatales bacterium]
MKIGNVPLPISERVFPQGSTGEKPDPGRNTAAGDGAAYRVELSRAAGKLAESGITTAAEALQVAGETREMIAASNREAASVQQGLDPRKLLDLLA